MKELRFRAWIKNYNCYADVLGFEQGRLFVQFQSGERSQHRLYVPIEDCILEQYTGLKDKNGKEIYEGDIVSERHGDIIGKIVRKPSGEYRIAWIGVYGGDSSLYDHRSLCEAIGNIHETPGLLVEVNDVN